MRRALLILLLLLTLAHPGISGMALTGLIDSSGTARISIGAGFISPFGSPACIILSASAEDVIVRDRSGLAIPHTISHDGNGTVICASVPVDYLEYSFSSPSFTSKAGSLWDFDLAIGSSENISSFNASVALPEGAVLKGANGAVQGGNGSLVVSYSASRIDTAHRARLRASYELDSGAGQQSPTINLPDIAVPSIVALAAVLFAFILAKKRRDGAKHPVHQEPAGTPNAPPGVPSDEGALESNPVFLTLDETDREILREIRRQGGKTTQAALNLNTHVPKATLSRRLASLENRLILKRSQKGNRNLVTFGDAITGSARA